MTFSSCFLTKLSRATTRYNFLLKAFNQSIKCHLTEILTPARSHGNFVRCFFLIADDKLIRQSIQAMLVYFIVDFFRKTNKFRLFLYV